MLAMVEVFRTNVQQKAETGRLCQLLVQQLPGCRIVFDLDDCDKVLKVEGSNFIPEQVVQVVKQSGFECSILE